MSDPTWKKLREKYWIYNWLSFKNIFKKSTEHNDLTKKIITFFYNQSNNVADSCIQGHSLWWALSFFFFSSFSFCNLSNSASYIISWIRYFSRRIRSRRSLGRSGIRYAIRVFMAKTICCGNRVRSWCKLNPICSEMCQWTRLLN